MSDGYSWKVESRYNNTIAFGVDISLLKNVVKSSMGSSAESVELKLVNRTVPVGAGVDQQYPFLVFDVKVKGHLLLKSTPCILEWLIICLSKYIAEKFMVSNTSEVHLVAIHAAELFRTQVQAIITAFVHEDFSNWNCFDLGQRLHMIFQVWLCRD